MIGDTGHGLSYLQHPTDTSSMRAMILPVIAIAALAAASPLSEDLSRINDSKELSEFRQLPPEFTDSFLDDPESRGVNWVKAARNEFKFLVNTNIYNKRNDSWFMDPCGGSIIGKRLLLTAAHCYDKQVEIYGKPNPDNIRVFFGEYDTTVKEPNENVTDAKAIIVHGGYDKMTKNDIAVVVLKADVPDYTEKICLDGSSIGGGVPVTIAGWGVTSSKGDFAKVLRKSTSEKTLTNAECKATGYRDSQIQDGMICATGTGSKGLEDSCQGDSGGPMFRKDGKWKQVGVVSWGSGCAKPNYPGVYARVSEYTEYIISTAKANGQTDVCIE